LDRELLCLGIESSCDDTAAAVVRGDRAILASVIMGQNSLHADFGGVVPEIAARAHAERIDLCIEQALEQAGISLGEIDLISATSGPGLIGGVLAGTMSAKALSVATGKPFIGVNHLAGHALTPRLTDGLEFPYLMLLVSGGHCQLLGVLGPDEFERIGGTIDDAPGEAFDKTAKLLGLGYPGGPEVEREASEGDADRFEFPRPLLDRNDCNMSFSGLKTALRRARDTLVAQQGGLFRTDRADLCAGFQKAVAEVLAAKTRLACYRFREVHNADRYVIAVAGGVAANTEIRKALEKAADETGFQFTAPPLSLCTDNAAMIAWAGLERYSLGHEDGLDLATRSRWPLDEAAAPLIGSGKRGVKA
jgi:tRNA N6-adenosine threonylcarbamoyltransferase